MQVTVIDEPTLFYIFDHLHHTADGSDGIHVWLRQHIAATYVTVLAHLLNKSFTTSHYLINRITHSTSCQSQNPKTPSEYRPISVLPVISRLVERYVGHRLIYPAFLTPPMDNLIKNQFAFRPTGSTTAAIISIVHNINELL